MNLGLFRSGHALIAAALVALFWFWQQSGDIAFGRGASSDVGYLLWTGWVAFFLYIVLALYAARKSAHRTRLTPEFGMEVGIEKIERAESRLSAEIRARVLAGAVTARSKIRREAARILRQEGVQKVVRAVLEKGPPGGPRHVLRLRPREPLGKLAKWMHVHIFYGLAAGCLVWFHGGMNVSSPMGLFLNGLSYLVIGTGFIGILFWVFGPSLLTRAETDLPIERAFVLREHYARKVAAQCAKLEAADVGVNLKGLSRLGLGHRRRESLGSDALAEAPGELRDELRDLLVLAGQRDNVRSEWRRLARLRAGLNAWRLIHVPASIVLMVAVVVHIVSVTWY